MWDEPAVVKDGRNGTRVVYMGRRVLKNPAPMEAIEVARALNGRLTASFEHRRTARDIVARHGSHHCNRVLLRRETIHSIFVDQPSLCLPTRSWPWTRSCRMFIGPSDDPQMSLDELHAFATNLLVTRDWFRDDRVMPHYMLTCSKREDAICFGANPVSRSTFSDVMKMWQRVR
jgi:hypothetical protein